MVNLKGFTKKRRMHAVHAGILRSVSFTRGWGRTGGKAWAVRKAKDRSCHERKNNLTVTGRKEN